MPGHRMRRAAAADVTPDVVVAHTQSAAADATVWESSSINTTGKTLVAVFAQFKIGQTPSIPTAVVDAGGAADSMTALVSGTRADAVTQQQGHALFGIDRRLDGETVTLTFPSGDFNLLRVVVMSVHHVGTVEAVDDTDSATVDGTTPCTLSALDSGELAVVMGGGDGAGSCTQDELTSLDSGTVGVLDWDVGYAVDYDGTNVQFDLSGSPRTCVALGVSWA